MRLAASKSGVDVQARLNSFFHGEARSKPSPKLGAKGFVPELLGLLRGDLRPATLARSVGATRLTVGRWLVGSSEPRLPQLLRFVAGTTQRLLDFVALFADPEALASTHAAWRDLQAQRRVAYELPWSHAVLRALELARYKQLSQHEPGFIARLLGLPLSVENEALNALSQARQIRLLRGKWAVARVLTVDTRPDPAKNLALKRHWAEVGVQRIGQEGLFSYNLCSIAEADYQRLQSLHRAYFEQMRAVIAGSRGGDRILLANVQLFSLTP